MLSSTSSGQAANGLGEGETISLSGGRKGFIIFPAPRGQRKGVWQRVKQAIAEEMSDLTSMTADERKEWKNLPACLQWPNTCLFNLWRDNFRRRREP